MRRTAALTAPRLAALALMAAALAVYGAGALRSPLLDGEAAARRAVITVLAQQAEFDPLRETVLARTYWDRNPDVREDAYFGEEGPLGILGAREHYDRHGRLEGRGWGP